MAVCSIHPWQSAAQQRRSFQDNKQFYGFLSAELQFFRTLKPTIEPNLVYLNSEEKGKKTLKKNYYETQQGVWMGKEFCFHTVCSLLGLWMFDRQPVSISTLTYTYFNIDLSVVLHLCFHKHKTVFAQNSNANEWIFRD